MTNMLLRTSRQATTAINLYYSLLLAGIHVSPIRGTKIFTTEELKMSVYIRTIFRTLLS